MKRILLLPILVFAVTVATAGPLDDLKQSLKDQAQQAKDDAQQAAQQKADDAAQQAADRADQAQKSADEAKPAEPASAPEQAPAPADQMSAASSDASAAGGTPDQAPAGPPLPALTVEIRSVDPRGDGVTPTAPVTELSSWVPQLFATGRGQMANDDTFAFTARIVAEDVPGVPHGLVVVPPPPDVDSARVSAENPAQTLPLALPRALLPGRYRVELVEPDPPGRVAGTGIFVMKAGDLAGGDFDLADTELGGLMERVSGEDGAGLTWAPRVLFKGNVTPWKPVPRADAAADSEAPELPCELVLSFFQRQPALVSRVEVTSAGADNRPREVEVWGSMQSATDGFVRLADVTHEEAEDTFAIPVPPTQARFVKIRIVSKQNDQALGVTGVRVIEGHAPGYQPLLTRFPEIANWRIQPRHAAQQGLYYLSASAVEFQQSKACMGCHVQSQALMGLAIAAKNDYVLSRATQRLLRGYTLQSQNDAGDFARTPDHGETEDFTNTIFAAMGIAYSHEAPGAEAQLRKAAQWLAAHQNPDGSVPTSDERLPVTQGAILHTSNAVDVWAEALKVNDDPAVRAALDRGLAYIAKAEPATTQDRVFQALAFLRHGDDARKKLARQICSQLLLAQQPDGGWRLEPDEDQPTSAFATGEVLYALRIAGFSIGSPAFQRGVRFLIFQQKADGSWQERPETTAFSSTMWPVIALAGSFTTKLEPAHLTITALPRPLPPPPPPPRPVAVATPGAARVLPRNLELVLDCSGSMNRDLGRSTRIDTAKEVMRDLIAKLPDDLQVGLRLYGHRYSSFSHRSNTDTELVVPIGPLNRDALVKVIDGAKARGETPLVLSALQAGDDLKKIGGGAIVLVTDGEESCGGNPREAGPQLAALSVPVRLDIIGFTLTGSRIAADMQAFAGATGGRFATAFDGVQLAKALAAATAAAPRPPLPPPPASTAGKMAPPEDFPYEIFNAAGEQVATTSTLNLAAPDLEPGTYRVVLHDGSRTIALDGIKIADAQTVELQYSPAAGRLQTAP